MKSSWIWVSGQRICFKICVLHQTYLTSESDSGLQEQIKSGDEGEAVITSGLHDTRRALFGVEETTRALQQSPLPRLLPCTHYNALKNIPRQSLSLYSKPRPPCILQFAAIMLDLKLFLSLFPARSMPFFHHRCAIQCLSEQEWVFKRAKTWYTFTLMHYIPCKWAVSSLMYPWLFLGDVAHSSFPLLP